MTPIELQHAAVWEVIDQMIDDVGTVAEMARRSGLEMAGLVPGSRASNQTGPRMPSIRTIIAMCRAAGWSLERFGREYDALIAAGAVPERRPRRCGNPKYWRKAPARVREEG